MYKIGQKVQILDVPEPTTGYIIKMEIDPLEEIEVIPESKEWIIYTIRVYKSFYINGYTDYCRTEREIKNADITTA
jgi:hypothetical protein